MREKQNENDLQVKLKPILGIRPGVYLTALYSFLILVILFFLLLYPGLKNPGAVLIVKTEPFGAAIRINGVYKGTSGYQGTSGYPTSSYKIPVGKGTHTIEAVMPGFESQSAVHEIPGRVFGSRFFPLQYKTEFTLKTSDPKAAFSHYAADFAAWTFAGEPTASWQIPMSLSRGAYRVGPYAAKSKETKEELLDILTAASRFTVTRAALRDLIRAKILLDNNGFAPSPVSLIGSISGILTFLNDNPGSAEWLAGLLPGETAAIIESSTWYENEIAIQPVFFPAFNNPAINRLELFGLTFIGIPEKLMLTRVKTGGSVSVKSFLISENPVPRSLFETFLNENPEWEEHYTDYFAEEIAINPIDIYNSRIVTGITWYAAEAFCKWLTTRLPQSLAHMEVRLPTENEWLSAAGGGLSSAGGGLSSVGGIRNMENPGWEWCADPFAPLDFIAANPKAVKAAGSPERTLRGKSFSGNGETKASLPPDLSSPFIRLRPVIAERE